MSDSSPRRGWDNTWQSIKVILAALGLLMLVLMFATGHAKAAVIVISLLCVAAIIAAWLRAGLREKDH
jgi:hypothetical protein